VMIPQDKETRGTTSALIAGRHVLLREMTVADAPIIVDWRNRPDVAQWLIQWEPLTVETHLRWFDRVRAAGDVLLTFTLHDGTPIGAGSLYDFDRARGCAEWGRLCTTMQVEFGPAIIEGCYLIHRLGFEVLLLERAYCGCSSGNAAALRLNRFIGYVDEGLRRRHLLSPDGYRDLIELGMLADDFQRRRPVLERMFYRNQVPPEPLDCAFALAKQLRDKHPPAIACAGPAPSIAAPTH
jgi:UDP-4-amino-4,6-dideoxy-N-acetyl-beta-L-altrosamine N-acetyltransferase